jgi:hypothetical protein
MANSKEDLQVSAFWYWFGRSSCVYEECDETILYANFVMGWNIAEFGPCPELGCEKYKGHEYDKIHKNYLENCVESKRFPTVIF